MAAIGTGYDLSASQFSSDGRIFQIEYAAKAIDNSGTCIVLRGKDGVVFGVEKLIISKLYEPGENKRIFTIGNHIGCAIAGVIADARAIIKQAQDEASNYRMEYGYEVPLKYLKNRVALYVHAHTLYSALRPFGASLLLGSWSVHEGPQLYCLEPSGDCNGYFGIGIGKAKQLVKTEIEKLKPTELTCEQLVKEAAKIIYIVHDEIKDKEFELELSWVGSFTNGKHEFVPKDLFNKAEEYAKEALRQDSDIDEDT